ncbi:ribonuclease H-like domain-containing protein [Tanacetum coccineum]
MSQPANDKFSQHLSDDEASNHEDASTLCLHAKQQHRKDGVIRILPPVTAAEIQAVEKERKAKNILLMAIPKEHMRRFHGMDDAKEIWEAIRTRFGGNANSKKMQKAVFKQQFEAFTISSSEGLGLEAHGAEVSTEDAYHKFLRSFPPAWSNLAMTMRTKPNVDTLSIDDLYNNLRVFEQEIQGASKTSSSAQNVAFVSQSKSSTNKVKSGFTGAYSTCTPSTSSTNIPKKKLLLIAMIAIRMKKFYKKTGRRVRVDGKTPVGFDKKKLECFNCHNTGHFARECTAKGTYDGKKKRDSFYQHQEAEKQEKNQMGLLTIDDGIVNWGEHTKDEETNHALMAISSGSEVSLCSKTCIDSYNTLKTLCDEQMNQLGDQEAQILAYSQAVKKLEAQLCTKEDSIGKPLYNRFIKANDFKGVPHPLSGDYTPTPQEEIDESLYVYGKKGPQEPEPNVSDDRSSEYSTCQSNDSAGSIGTSSEHSVDPESESSRVPPEVYVSTPITTNKKGVSAPKSKEVEPSWEGFSFTKKKCFVCGSLSHLIKDCDYYEKKMAREAEVKKQRVFNTGNGVAKPVWTNSNRVNHANQFVPRSVQLNTGRTNINSVRPNINTGRTNVNPVRPRVNTVNSNVNPVRSKQQVLTKISNSFSTKRPQVNQFNQRREIEDLLLRPQQVIIGDPLDQTPIVMDHPLKNMVDRGILDSGCSGHMTSNKDQLEDFEEFNGGFVTFGGSKGYITGKGKIRVSNLDFDSVSFVKELGHFNLFSISQICAKQHKFDGKSDEGFLVGYSLNSKAYRVYNLVTKRVEVNLHVNFLEDKPNVKGVSYPHAGVLKKVTDSAGTSQTPYSNASKEKDKDVEFIVVPSAVNNSEEKVESRTSSTKEETLTEPQQEKEASSTDTSEDNSKILAFRRFLRFQVKLNQGQEGIFIFRDKSVIEILKKFDLVNVENCNNPQWGDQGHSQVLYISMLLRESLVPLRANPIEIHKGGLLISWTMTYSGNAKKSDLVAISTTEDEYVSWLQIACGTVLWVQNQTA